MILTTAALLVIATAAAAVEPKSSEALLACAAIRYDAARKVERVKDASGLAATKGLGAVAPANRRSIEAARLRAEGDAFRESAASELSRGEIAIRYPRANCSAG